MTKRGLGSRLRKCRHALGLRVDDVQAALGKRSRPAPLHRQTVYRWEWERIEPTLNDLEQLADLFGATLDWLVRGEGPAPAYLTAPPAARGGTICLTG